MQMLLFRARPGALESIANGPDGIVSGLGPGKVLIDMSTVSPAASKALAEKVRAKGADMVDSPVSGSVITLEQGKLTMMVGGRAETFEKIKARPNPNLELLGVVITLHDRRTLLGKDIKQQIENVFGDKVFKTTISKSVRLEESPAYKESIFTFAPNSTGALEYYKLSEEVLGRV